MPVMTKINGIEKEYDSQEQADEAMGNNANNEAAQTWLRAAEGGAKYRKEAFGLAVLRYCVNDAIKAEKLKSKELTSAQIRTIVESVDDDDFEAAVTNARKLRAALGTLRSKYQSPMKGGLKPANVADAACVIVKPESGAAQTETAKAVLKMAM